MKTISTIAAVAGLCLLPAIALAQAYPTKSVQLVIPVPAGSSSDTMGRFVADGLSKLWGKPIVVENRPGASGMIGTGRVATSKADGYTLLFNSSVISVSKATIKDAGFDIGKDLRPVALASRGDLMMITGSRVALPTVASIVENAKTQTLFAADAGTGTPGSLMTRIFQQSAGIKMEGVSYKGASEAFIDLGGGRVDLYITSLASYLASGAVDKTKVVAILSDSRYKTYPDVPTTAELGFPEVRSDSFWGVFAPSGTPQAILDKINSDINTVMSQAASVEFLDTNYMRPVKMNQSETEAYIVEHYRKTEANFQKYGSTSN